MRHSRIFGFAIIALLLSNAGCKDEESTGGGEAFNRTVLLYQVTDACILPAFDSLAEASLELKVRLEDFSKNTEITELVAAQNAWRNAFRHFQSARMFNFGPSETSLLGDHNENLGTWPINTTLLESRIQSSDTTMKDFRRDSRGFGALEYLLFEPNGMANFKGADASKRFLYLQSVMEDIIAWTQRLDTDWLLYSTKFKNDGAKSAGSSTSELYNHWLQSYELLKNYKVALPAGLQVGQTAPAPELVESPYAHSSIQSIKWQLAYLEGLWYGRGLNGIEGKGFDDYLLTVTGGETLHNEIISQWAAIHAVLDPIDDTAKLSELVVNDPVKAQALFIELQKMTRFIKGDMSSLLGIAITYSSGDGD